jgi:hypothetical protein
VILRVSQPAGGRRTGREGGSGRHSLAVCVVCGQGEGEHRKKAAGGADGGWTGGRGGGAGSSNRKIIESTVEVVRKGVHNVKRKELQCPLGRSNSVIRWIKVRIRGATLPVSGGTGSEVKRMGRGDGEGVCSGRMSEVKERSRRGVRVRVRSIKEEVNGKGGKCTKMIKGEGNKNDLARMVDSAEEVLEEKERPISFERMLTR